MLEEPGFPVPLAGRLPEDQKVPGAFAVLLVGSSTRTDVDDQNHKIQVVDFINNPIIAHTNSPGFSIESLKF